MIATTDGIEVRRLVLGPLDNNCFVISCRATGASVIIDAAADAPTIAAACAGTTPLAILTTHGHGDHVGAAHALADLLSVPIALHEADVFLTGWAPDMLLEDRGTLSVGEVLLDVHHTPGHTPGSVCFHVDGHLFTGDTLFPGGPGATRFPYSDFDTIMASLEDRLFVFDEATPFHPGHGASSTLADEQPQLEEWHRRRW